MAVVREFVSEVWEPWIASRPAVIREMAAKWPPDRLYRMPGGQRVFIHSYSEGGTVTVIVSGAFQLVTFERCVFGIDPAGLVECDLPGEDEPVGVLFPEDASLQP